MLTVIVVWSTDLRHGELTHLCVWQNLEYLRFFEVVYFSTIYICVMWYSMWVYFVSNSICIYCVLCLCFAWVMKCGFHNDKLIINQSLYDFFQPICDHLFNYCHIHSSPWLAPFWSQAIKNRWASCVRISQVKMSNENFTARDRERTLYAFGFP